MDNRERAMVEAARECLVNLGRNLDDRFSSQDNDLALAAAIEKANSDMIIESFCQTYDMTDIDIQPLLVTALASSDQGVLGSAECEKFGRMCAAMMSSHFMHFVSLAKASLPFDGESDEEGWRDIDNAQRASGF